MNDIENELSNNTVSDGDIVFEVYYPTRYAGNLNYLVSGGDVIPTSDIQFSCSCADDTPLWQSDIADYGVTDGLLLLILIVLSIQTFIVSGKRGK